MLYLVYFNFFTSVYICLYIRVLFSYEFLHVIIYTYTYIYMYTICIYMYIYIYYGNHFIRCCLLFICTYCTKFLRRELNEPHWKQLITIPSHGETLFFTVIHSNIMLLRILKCEIIKTYTVCISTWQSVFFFILMHG